MYKIWIDHSRPTSKQYRPSIMKIYLKLDHLRCCIDVIPSDIKHTPELQNNNIDLLPLNVLVPKHPVFHGIGDTTPSTIEVPNNTRWFLALTGKYFLSTSLCPSVLHNTGKLEANISQYRYMPSTVCDYSGTRKYQCNTSKIWNFHNTY